MSLGAVLTLVMIYLILACAFSSYVWPLAIMTAIPFGLTGAILGHWIWGEDIGAMSLLAFFCLSGVVVNDSIVLISFLRRELENGSPLRAALEHSVSSRFRAVFLTSATTSIGLLPMLIGRGSLDFYTVPIAITIGFGLTMSTTARTRRGAGADHAARRSEDTRAGTPHPRRKLRLLSKDHRHDFRFICAHCSGQSRRPARGATAEATLVRRRRDSARFRADQHGDLRNRTLPLRRKRRKRKRGLCRC
jgi:hypothetical protein